MTTEQIWAAALGELQLQMTKATFDTWIKPARAVESKNGVFVIGVANEFCRDWLESRLGMVIARTLVGITGQPVEVEFVVTERASVVEALVAGEDSTVETVDQGGMIAVRFYEFDPRIPFLQVPKYAEYFWQPLLGSLAYATYRFLRCKEKLNEGWGGWRFVSVDLLVATVAEDNRQAITGVQRWTGGRKGQGEKYWQPGAFNRLEEAAVVQIERLGKGKNLSYRISCLHSLPLLVPMQVETLPEVLQIAHADWIRRSKLEFEEWQQLVLPTLVQK